MTVESHYALFPASDEDGNMMGLSYVPDHPARSFASGRAFSRDPSAPPWERPPIEPVQLAIKKGRENAPFPSFLREPAPIASKQLLATLRAAGVDNLELYRAELRYADGRLASAEYHVFNLVGLVRTSDHAGELLMFRLAENLPTILIDASVKRAIDAACIPLVRILRFADAAIL